MKTSTLYQIAIFLLLGALAAVSIGYWQQEQQMHYAHLWIQGLSASRDEAQARAADAEDRAAAAERRAADAEAKAASAEERAQQAAAASGVTRYHGQDIIEDRPITDSSRMAFRRLRVQREVVR